MSELQKSCWKKLLEGSGEESQESYKSAGHDWLIYVGIILWQPWEWKFDNRGDLDLTSYLGI